MRKFENIPKYDRWKHIWGGVELGFASHFAGAAAIATKTCESRHNGCYEKHDTIPAPSRPGPAPLCTAAIRALLTTLSYSKSKCFSTLPYRVNMLPLNDDDVIHWKSFQHASFDKFVTTTSLILVPNSGMLQKWLVWKTINCSSMHTSVLK